MSDITLDEKLRLEVALGMGGGYVAGFTNRALERFVHDVLGIGIYEAEFAGSGQSKAKRLRVLLETVSNGEAAQLLEAFHRQWELIKPPAGSWEAPQELLSVARRLRSGADGNVPSHAAEVEELLSSAATGDDFAVLIKAVRDAVEDGQPAVGLDRLHTYMTKLFRALCDRHSIPYVRNMSLNSLAGGYVRHLRESYGFRSAMTAEILKGSVKVLEAFNDVRNNQSLAHANELLDDDESNLIISDIVNLVRFISAKEQALPMLDEAEGAGGYASGA